MRRYPLLALLLCLAAATVYAQNPNNPYNSPIRDANPNSLQGTAPPAGVPNNLPGRVQPRQPTVENRGIGNGDNLRPRPPAVKPATPPPARTTPRLGQ